MKLQGLSAALGLAAIALVGANAPAFAQTQSGYTSLTVTPAAQAAARASTVVHRKHQSVSSVVQPNAAGDRLSPSQQAVASGPHSGGNGGGQGGARYPADLFGFGGPTLLTAQHHAIFFQPFGKFCKVSDCWGNPEGFLKNLSRSNFIHITDQYTGVNSNNRYPVGQGYQLAAAPPAIAFTDSDMIAFVIAAAQVSGQVGYGHFYHVFLPPGVDECFDDSFSVCYSPDNPPSYFFCAYHGSVDVQGLGHLVYSVEPYQNVGGCAVRSGTPNGPLADSTNSVLSHEVFEAITDPDGTGWWNLLDNGLYGEEIGDECSFLAFDNAGNFLGFDPSIWSAGDDKTYATQPEYNNNRHACTTAP